MRSFEMFEIHEPQAQTAPLVFSSPHSGRIYPPEFLAQSRLSGLSIRRSEDPYVDELFAAAPLIGAPLIAANFPRAYVDVNREPYELDPRMFDGALPSYANIGSVRVAGGLGTIPRIVAENMEIYRHRIPVEEALDRIETVYKPYHASLRRLISQTHTQFGFEVLVDCHSMPGSLRNTGSAASPDIIIGDRYGTSSAPEFSQAAIYILKELGLRAVRNKPYAGGFITEHYGRPGRGLHALQIEINRALYVNEATLEKRRDFSRLADAMTLFMRGMADHAQAFSLSLVRAAE